MILITVFTPSLVRAQDSPFIIKDIVVDVTADNSLNAQEQAYVKAKFRAFNRLARRLVQDTQIDQIQSPGADVIESLIQDYEITNERVSAVRYVGTYTFRFRPKAVSEYFSLSGVNYTSHTSRTLLVLPVFQTNGKNTLWSEGNHWMQAWHRNEVSGGLVPIEVPIGDLMDIADIDDSQALRYERRLLDRMLGRYDAQEASIMIAVPDINLSSVQQDTQRAIGTLRISVYRTDRIKAEHVQDIVIQAQQNETRAQLYDRAVMRAYKALQKDWKTKTVSNISQSQSYRVRATYQDIQEWLRIQNALKTVIGLSDLTILSLKPVEAYLSFTFRGEVDRLREAMSHTRISLGQGYPDRNYQFRHFGSQTQESIVYDLVYGETTRPKSSVHTF